MIDRPFLARTLVSIIAFVTLGANVAYADEIHDKAMASTQYLRQSIDIMHVMQQQHGPEFGGHMARAEQLATQAERERDAALKYYRAHHPGWR